MFFKVSFRTSDAIEAIYVNPLKGVVELAYAKGNLYRYTNVSRRAIINLLLNPSMSLGFWVNTNCKGDRAKCEPLAVWDVKQLPTFAV